MDKSKYKITLLLFTLLSGFMIAGQNANAQTIGDIGIVPFATTCNGSYEGTMRYDTTNKILEFCDGINWNGLDQSPLRQVSGGNAHSCGITVDNMAYCWGFGGNGRLGNNNTTDQSTAGVVQNGANTSGTWKAITTGISHTCGIGTDQKAYCWGSPGDGKLGNNSTSGDQLTPVLVQNGANTSGTWLSISTYGNYNCGISTDQKAYCWGQGTLGKLGNNNNIDQLTPVLVQNGENTAGTWLNVSAGERNSCGVSTDNKAYCWGSALDGPLGNNATSGDFLTPVLVSNGANTIGTWKMVSANDIHSCGVSTDNKAYCWGRGTSGQLGNGSTASPQSVPVLVSNGANTAGTWKAVSGGGTHNCGIGMNNSLYCWGSGTDGRLGNNGTANQTTPVLVANGANTSGTWHSIEHGRNHSCGIGSDNKAYCWGQSDANEVGNGSTADQLTPDLVSNLP